VAVSRWAFLGAMILTGAPELLAEALYYRYPSINGTIVIDSSVPPEAVPRGYDVIRVDGSVVRTVAPQLSDAERKTRALELEVAAARAEADAKSLKWDESLLLRYSSVLDIDAAKERAINNIKVRISILESNLSLIKQQILSNQRDAAELERRGKDVPSALMNTLASLRREVTTTEQHIRGRLQDIDEVARGYERDKARFALLESQSEKRLQYYSPDD
jgi:chromosome segregation ATPase